jgi:hypothetical protein
MTVVSLFCPLDGKEANGSGLRFRSAPPAGGCPRSDETSRQIPTLSERFRLLPERGSLWSASARVEVRILDRQIPVRI